MKTGVVVVGHGRLAEEMVQTLEDVVGKSEGLAAVSTGYAEPPERIRDRIAAMVRRVDQGAGVIILTDMYGDTPTNQSLEIARACGAEVVAGVNMPILVKLMSAREGMSLPELAAFIRRYGQEHIFWVTERAGNDHRS